MIEGRPVHIRAEAQGDIEDIHHVHAVSFATSLEAKLVDALRDSGRLRISLVAEVEESVVGHVAFSPVTLAGSADGVGLGPVAVLPDFRRRGIADQLIRAGLTQSSLDLLRPVLATPGVGACESLWHDAS